MMYIPNRLNIRGNRFEVNKRSREDGTMKVNIITMDGDGHCCNVTDLS